MPVGITKQDDTELEMLTLRKEGLIKRLSDSNYMIKNEIFSLKQLIEERDGLEVSLIHSKKTLKKMKETSLNLNKNHQFTWENVQNKEISEEEYQVESQRRERQISAIQIGLKNISNKYMDTFVKYGDIEDQIAEQYRSVKDLELECLDILQKLDAIRQVLGEE